jgi:hypothetical protein
VQGESTDEPPAWFGEAIATVEVQTGETIRPSDSWLRYSGHRAGKGIAKTPQDAVYWLTTVMVPEARKERRDASDRREREAKWDRQRDRQRAGPEPERLPVPTAEESKAFAAEIAARVAARRKGAA